MAVKIPEIERALDIINQLAKPKENNFEIDYMICDTIYSKANVNKDINKVNLWLGANTMVEFTFEEAKKLLGKNLENAQNNLSTFVSFHYIIIFISIFTLILSLFLY
jgi:prefoldin subunit 5